jgi:hypothetical protein
LPQQGTGRLTVGTNDSVWVSEFAMIKDVMVRLDGTSGDDVRLAAVNQIAEIFESHITGLFFNVLPSLVPDGRNDAGAGKAAKFLDTAKQAGDIIEAKCSNG